MKTLKIRTNSIKVKDDNGMELLVARYEDKNGVYFLNENLKKQYAIIETHKQHTTITEESEIKSFRFDVEYEHKGMDRGWNQKTTKVNAKNITEAIEKVKRSFKTIYDISEI